MPNKDSARKALRQNKKRAELNSERRDAFKKAIKEVIRAKNREEALKLIQTAQKKLDKAAGKGTIKKNTAARRLSRLATKINAKFAEKK